jgi:hypothetical protein
MKASSLNEIKKELSLQEPETLQEICIRLARYKKENKELLTYLLFEAQDEHAYIENVKAEIDTLFAELPKGNTYYIKKSLRKVLRFANRQIKYSGIKQTELEIRIFFCVKMKEARIPLHSGTVLRNLYDREAKKIKSILNKLPEDIQGDYTRELKTIETW